LLALAIVGVCVGLTPLAPSDFWWHLRVGQVIAERGYVPNVDLFSWSVPTGTHYTYGAWLAELAWYRLYEIGGAQAILFLRNALALAAFALVGLLAQARSGSWASPRAPLSSPAPWA